MHKIYIFFALFLSLNALCQDKKTEGYFLKGMESFKKRDYKDARIWFLRTIEKDQNFAEAYFRLGQIAESSKNDQETKEYYLKSIELDSANKSFVRAFSYLGNHKMEKQEYDEAIVYLEKAMLWTSPKSIVYQQYERQIAKCQFAKATMAAPLKIKPEKMPAVLNFKQKQYFPVFTADGKTLFYTARNERADEDIYFSDVKSGIWDIPMPISSNINTPFNEGTCSVSADGRLMVFTSCERNENIGSCDLYYTKKIGDNWSVPQNLGKNINSPFWDSQPSLSTDGKRLFFASDRPESIGKKDIFMSEMNSEGQWGKAINLGNKINTPYDEVSPFIHANGRTLFFASMGHTGLGGFDLFLSNRLKGQFQEPVNLGYPVNTQNDQFAIFISADGKNAFYSVEKGDSVNLYQFVIPKTLSEKFDPTFYIKGKVVDAKSKQAIKANIQLIDLSDQEVISNFENQQGNGEYMAVLPSTGKYALYIESKDHFFKSVGFDLKEEQEAPNIELNIELSEIEKNKSETLNNIYFNTASWDLLDESKVELGKLITLIRQNPTLNVEISGHTDDIGSDESNLQLSERRAQSVVNYLVNSGIKPGNLKAVGYGETKPILPNDSEANRSKNRRIEMKFL